jgi:stage V sporulation protein SpoVS
LDGRPINRARVIEVDSSALRNRQMRAIPVEIVQRQARGFWTKEGLELFCQPCFTGSASSHDGNQQGRGFGFH